MRQVILTAFLALAFGPAFAADQVPPTPVSEATVVETVPAPADDRPAPDGLVSLDFQDADIHNVLKVLAYKSGVNIVTGPEVNGVVTIQLKNVPWQKALEVILSTYGYGYEQRGNIITITTVENLKKRREDEKLLQDQEPLITKTFTLNFAKAADVVDSVGKIKSPRGSVNFDQRTNTLIVRDVSSAVELMDTVVKTLDAVTPQVSIEARVVETDLDHNEKLGIDWTTVASVNGAKRPSAFPFEVRQTNNVLPGPFPSPTTSLFSYGTVDFSQLQAILQILNTRTNTKILSNPKIVTLDNQTAKIVVGSQYPIPQYTYNTEQAKLQVSGWEYKDIGVIFEVTPHVNNPGLITMDLHPTITAISGSATVENTTLPQLSVEEANTKVMIENGQTLVIAGLIKEQTDITNKKIPLLGDIPLLGNAFKSKTTTKSKTELLIFLTPHIVTVKQQAPPQQQQPQAK